MDADCADNSVMHRLIQFTAVASIAISCASHKDGPSSNAAGANADSAQAGAGTASTVTSGGAMGGAAGHRTSVGGAPSTAGGAGAPGAVGALRILVFTRTTGYRHTSIETGVAALQALAQQRNWQIVATEDPTEFTDASLAAFDIVLFLSTTGEVLDATQKAAMERFIRAGHGYVGVHAASDTEYDWPWYGALVGAYFKGHPAIQEATILVAVGDHPMPVGAVSPWRRTDEWYAFQSNPRGQVHVLLQLDETSYDAGDTAMGDDHPIAWYHEYDGGRAFYTALGHTEASYQESKFLAHLAGGIEWAGGAR